MQTISVLIICLDEEELIGKCLYWLFENIKPDEYIIVDGGSEDDTIKIINKFTVNNQVNLKLFKNPMPDSFSKQRNLALSKCTSDWILHIDTDETYSKNITKLISDIRVGKHNDTTGFVFPTAHLIIDGSHMIDGGGDIHFRLFKNLSNMKYVGEVHEKIYFDNLSAMDNLSKFNIKSTNNVALRHYSMLSSDEALLKKGKRWIRWLERSRKTGIPLTDENHFVNAVKKYKDNPLEVPKEWE